MAWSKVHWVATCRKHGTEETGSPGIRYLKVGEPKSKRHRKEGGCPRCKAEKSNEDRLATLKAH